MGGWVTRLWWGGDPDSPHPASGLSRRDVYLVKRQWKAIYANVIPNGVELFKRYFRAHPDAKRFFIFVSKLREDDYDTSAQFKAHVLNLMGALNAAVEHLHEPDVAAALMAKVGESHRRRSIKKQNFYDMKDVFLKMLAEVTESDQVALQSWGRAVDFLFGSILTTLEPDPAAA
ncbi:Cytoglobin [Eumeta japonica]|uniref:Cytoglobin n=1 Tax=Eumeta variegata TaxID=151549 RepID=A0A4C1VKI9_EUMVA|nr:Cytoglobin [Eumeta japonica]